MRAAVVRRKKKVKMKGGAASMAKGCACGCCACVAILAKRRGTGGGAGHGKAEYRTRSGVRAGVGANAARARVSVRVRTCQPRRPCGFYRSGTRPLSSLCVRVFKICATPHCASWKLYTESVWTRKKRVENEWRAPLSLDKATPGEKQKNGGGSRHHERVPAHPTLLARVCRAGGRYEGSRPASLPS